VQRDHKGQQTDDACDDQNDDDSTDVFLLLSRELASVYATVHDSVARCSDAPERSSEL
jgi:hypothetical protein